MIAYARTMATTPEAIAITFCVAVPVAFALLAAALYFWRTQDQRWSNVDEHGSNP